MFENLADPQMRLLTIADELFHLEPSSLSSEWFSQGLMGLWVTGQ